MSFVGSATHGDTMVRRRLESMCKSYNDSAVCTWSEMGWGMHDLRRMMLLKGRSRFCLEPQGDSPFRKSISDSISMGCVPVTFSSITAGVAPWHWGGWRARGQVAVPRAAFIAGQIDLRALLTSVPADLAAEMRAAMAANGSKWQFALDDSVEDDAFKVLLRGAAAAARHRCALCNPLQIHGQGPFQIHGQRSPAMEAPSSTSLPLLATMPAKKSPAKKAPAKKAAKKPAKKAAKKSAKKK
jgi:hypothetical protein